MTKIFYKNMSVKIHESWKKLLEKEFEKPYWKDLTDFVRHEYQTQICYPEAKNIFRAFDITPPENLKVVILGQDPYHTPRAAMGLSFSVPNENGKLQPSLRNIFAELQDDLGIVRDNSDLTDWAEQGILLLNAVLTVRSGEPASHKGYGWEIFTDVVISTISENCENVVFVLWGNYAIAKKSLIDEKRHKIIESPHPSPFSAHK